VILFQNSVSQTTRKSTLEGNSEQSMSKTAGKSKRKDNVGCNLEVQETVERSDSEEEAGEQMDVPNEPKIMSKPSRRSTRSSKVTTNRSVNYPKKSTMAKKLNNTISTIKLQWVDLIQDLPCSYIFIKIYDLIYGKIR
jgi:hypothetical protein